MTPTPLSSATDASPDYVGLVRFLVQPFLESPDALKVDCEVLPSTSRVLLRLAFDGEDKGRVFGRGGRNIQAVRAVLQAIAQTAGHNLHLDVYGSASGSERDSPPRESSRDSSNPRSSGSRGGPRRPPRPRPQGNA